MEKQVEPIVDVSHDATNPIVGATNPHVYVMQTDARQCFLHMMRKNLILKEEGGGGGEWWDYLMALFHLLGPLPRLCEANPAWRNKIFIFSCTIATYWGAL